MPTVSELQELCQFLGLELESKGKPLKRDYIRAIQGHSMREAHPDGIPWPLLYRCELESPMLCAKLSALKPEDQDVLWKGEEWWFQEMVPGERIFLIFERDGDGRSGHRGAFVAYGRETDEKTFLPQEVGVVNLPDDADVAAHIESCVLDCRYEGGEFYAVDILEVDGRDLREEPFFKRLSALRSVVGMYKKAGGAFHHLRTVQDPKTKLEWFSSLAGSDAMGVIAKHRDSEYRARKARSVKHWVKITPADAGEVRARGVDGVLGYTSGALYFASSPPKDPHLIFSAAGKEIATIPVPKSLAEQVIDPETGELETYAKGMVAELDGEISEGTLTNARIMRWRPDKTVEQCKELVSDG